MYFLITAIGYGYIILMMTITADSIWSGLAVFFGLGVIPLWLLRKALGRHAKPALRPAADQPDSQHPSQDQRDL